MLDLFEIFQQLSYAGIFLLLIALNAAPILVPPSWIVLSSFHLADPGLDVLTLSLVGASGSLIGRIVLMYFGRFFRRLLSQERTLDLGKLASYLNRKKYGYLITSFVFAITPLPSNMLFIAYGLMRAKSIGMLVGFWCGRVLSYYVMITTSKVLLKPFLELFTSNILGIVVIDICSVGAIVAFACINWSKLINERKIGFVRPKIWKF